MSDAGPVLDQDIASRLGLGRKSRRWRRRLYWLGGIGAVVLALGYFMFRPAAPHTYVTKQVARGSLAVTVSATGTLAPRNQVDVGAEVSGRIDVLNVDFNDHVKKGQELARINTDQIKAASAGARHAGPGRSDADPDDPNP